MIVDDPADGSAVYLVDAAGEAWRVWDALTERPRRNQVATPPDGLSTHRIFVSRDRSRRAYTFSGTDWRALTPSLLVMQLAAAERVS